MPANDEPRTAAHSIVDATASGVVRIGRHGGRGCGVVVDTGVVLTNAHNLRDRTTQVTFADGRAVQARTLGVDHDGDLAVLEVDTADATPVTWSDGTVDLGDAVYSVARTGDGVRLTPPTGTAFGTTQIKTGQRIRVDGNNGVVTLLD